MNLNFSINFRDLNSLTGLQKIDQIFLNYLAEKNHILHENLLEKRLSFSVDSNFLIELAPYLDDFVAELFFIEAENLAFKQQQQKFDIIYECRRKFVQRVVKSYKPCRDGGALSPDSLSDEDNFSQISQTLTNFLGKITEKNFAENVLNWLQNPEKFKSELDVAAAYACYMVENNSTLPLFNVPRIVDESNKVRKHRINMLAQNPYIGFDYRDHEASLENAMSHAKYCIYCHNQQKDSCRTGLWAQSRHPSEAVGRSHSHPEEHEVRREDPLTLEIATHAKALCASAARNDDKDKTGCPLDQKISEMNKLFAGGFNIGALGVTVIDNPLVAATGHRICNDCMKSCIFQKQDPVNIPLLESKILDNVLSMPYGVEIYLLLTKWNPLNIQEPLPLAPTGYNVLVVGLGPAGFALSHYLLNQGHNVTAIDGLKIQNLEFDITKPIADWQKIKVPLSTRLPQGFGGVAEYGITNRWDKNNLILVRLILERSNAFKMIGGVRLGSNLSKTQAFELGFDHIALCLGAGKPRYINSDSYFFKGVKSAADFLMNLQQGGSYLDGSNSKLLVRLPAVVIGCGLTAVDSAVEIIHYYPNQVENFLCAYEQNPVDLATLNAEDKIIAEEFMAHAKLFRQTVSDKEKLKVLETLGGVSVCYRNVIKESPAYKRNHEEIEHAMAIGVRFVENISPLEVMSDKYDCAKQIQFQDLKGDILTMDARTVLVAIGTEELEQRSSRGSERKDDGGGDNILLTRFGDYDPEYSGSVVKALASAKNGYKKITEQLGANAPRTRFGNLYKVLDDQLRPYVHHIKEISSEVLELVIKSPLAAKNYRAGQIFRLQNLAMRSVNTMKPLALSPYEVDRSEGLIYFLITRAGNSTKLCWELKEGEEVVLMGPNGGGTNITQVPRVILIGYGVRNMALLPIAKAFKEQGTEVIFWANYAKKTDVLYPEKIENVADKVLWSVGEISSSAREGLNAEIQKNIKLDPYVRSDDLSQDDGGGSLRSLADDPIIAYVPAHILPQIKQILPDSNIVANLLSPMQCMMQGICGQCIQKVDDKGYVFACACLEYDIKKFNPKILSDRLGQNSLLEKVVVIQRSPKGDVKIP